MNVVVWVLAVWLLSLTLFVALMASRERAEHPRPPKRNRLAEDQWRVPPAA